MSNEYDTPLCPSAQAAATASQGYRGGGQGLSSRAADSNSNSKAGLGEFYGPSD